MEVLAVKNWDHYVAQTELVSRTDGFMALRDRILEPAKIEPDEVVLDICAGTGLLTLPAAAPAARVWAVDISPQMCETRIGAGHVKIGSAASLDLPAPMRVS